MRGFGEHKQPKKVDSSEQEKRFLSQAVKLHHSGKFGEASRCYELLITNGSKNPLVYFNYGFLLQSLGRLQKAESSTRKAILLKPDFADAHFNLGEILNNLGKLNDSEIYIRKGLELKPDSAIAHCNLGRILRKQGKLKDAKESTLKAIALKPDFAIAYCNLGNILKNLGQLNDSKLALIKALEIQPDLIRAYYSLSLLPTKTTDQQLIDYLFSEDILRNKPKKDIVDIYFARSNILHAKKVFSESSKYLRIANALKLKLRPSNIDLFLKKSNNLMIESKKRKIKIRNNKNLPQSIFIVGMPRSGSTLCESILSMDNDVKDLGEINIFEEAYLYAKQLNDYSNLNDTYLDKTGWRKEKFNISTNKWLYNFRYTGIICNAIPNAKIIHCFRNPLDNILSIYRANFSAGNEYSSCLMECARMYIDQEKVMNEYKKVFKSSIYDFNYDLLVTNPQKEIKVLINWLNWEWDDKYLYSHKNNRSVSTASSVQVRSPINKRSINGWKNYKEMLKPAIKILKEHSLVIDKDC